MISFCRQSADHKQHMLLFGGGLIGSAIHNVICKGPAWRATRIDWKWDDLPQRQQVAAQIETDVRGSERIDIVWAAGISGFASTDADMEAESAHVAEIAGLAQKLAARGHQIVFHLFSSIGGLHEGQRAIGPQSVVATRRPYGRGKLTQESLIEKLGSASTIIPRIYRPSSVYGYARAGRRGLFATMIASMLSYRPIEIYGSVHTLRDYVFAPDIGVFVVESLDRPPSPALEFIASGKPTGVTEAITVLERLLDRRAFCRFSSAPHNMLDMTVHRTAIPTSLPRTPLLIGVASVLQNMSRSVICQPYEQR